MPGGFSPPGIVCGGCSRRTMKAAPQGPPTRSPCDHQAGPPTAAAPREEYAKAPTHAGQLCKTHILRTLGFAELCKISVLRGEPASPGGGPPADEMKPGRKHRQPGRPPMGADGTPEVGRSITHLIGQRSCRSTATPPCRLQPTFESHEAPQYQAVRLMVAVPPGLGLASTGVTAHSHFPIMSFSRTA